MRILLCGFLVIQSLTSLCQVGVIKTKPKSVNLYEKRTILSKVLYKIPEGTQLKLHDFIGFVDGCKFTKATIEVENKVLYAGYILLGDVLTKEESDGYEKSGRGPFLKSSDISFIDSYSLKSYDTTLKKGDILYTTFNCQNDDDFNSYFCGLLNLVPVKEDQLYYSTPIIIKNFISLKTKNGREYYAECETLNAYKSILYINIQKAFDKNKVSIRSISKMSDWLMFILYSKITWDLKDNSLPDDYYTLFYNNHYEIKNEFQENRLRDTISIIIKHNFIKLDSLAEYTQCIESEVGSYNFSEKSFPVRPTKRIWFKDLKLRTNPLWNFSVSFENIDDTKYLNLMMSEKEAEKWVSRVDNSEFVYLKYYYKITNFNYEHYGGIGQDFGTFFKAIVDSIEIYDTPLYANKLTTLLVLKWQNERLAADEIYYEQVFSNPQISARFLEGYLTFDKYSEINLNLKIPIALNAPKGVYEVEVSFIVDKQGKASDVVAHKDPGYGMKAEAERIIRDWPKWTPGVENGRKVKSITKQKVVFNIQ